MARDEQKSVRRQEIIEKSLDLFIAKGYAATKISDIAKTVNMSVGLLFHYFDSKEALYEALIDIGVSGPKSVMDIPFENSLEFFTKVTHYIVELPKLHLFSVKMFVFMNQAVNSTAVPDRIKEKLSQIINVELCVPIIERGQAEGTIKDGDPLALSNCFWSAIQGVMESLALHPEYPTPEAEWLIDIVRRRKE